MVNEHYVRATVDDCTELAAMNRQLILDEGHGNRMTPAELAIRMRGFLDGDYTAYLVRVGGVTAGYCLYRADGERIHIRQLYVQREFRRCGVGRRMVAWLRAELWPGRETTMDVLSGNAVGLAFWRSLGFRDYCVTMTLAGDSDARQ